VSAEPILMEMITAPPQPWLWNMMIKINVPKKDGKAWL
jgi:hypothetical protein